MRLVHVITRLIVGGAQENTVASVLGLRQKPGVQVELWSGPTTGPEGSIEARVAAVPGLFRRLPSLVRPVRPWHDLRAWLELTAWLRAFRPDLVHTHSGKAGLLGRLAAHRAGVRVIVHTIHGPSFGPFQGAVANAAFRTAERWAGKVTTHFVSVADAMTRQYLAAGIGEPGQYTRIFSGFALAPFLGARPDPAFRAQLGFGPEDVVVGKIARLFELKGHAELFAVAPTLVRADRRIKFLLVGDGTWRGRFERQVAGMGLADRVVFAGLVPPDEMPRYVAAMDLLVHLSRREGLPRALPQALAVGRPVVAFDQDGAREVCLDGRTGFLVAVGHAAGLTRRVLELAGDGRERERMGQAGQALVREQFAEEKMVDDLHALYRRLMVAPKGH